MDRRVYRARGDTRPRQIITNIASKIDGCGSVELEVTGEGHQARLLHWLAGIFCLELRQFLGVLLDLEANASVSGGATGRRRREHGFLLYFMKPCEMLVPLRGYG